MPKLDMLLAPVMQVMNLSRPTVQVGHALELAPCATRPRYNVTVIGGVASSTALVTALMGYASGGQTLTATGLCFVTAFVVTSIALAVAGSLERPENTEEAQCAQDLAPLPPVSAEPNSPPDEPLDVERLSEAVCAVSPFVHVVGEHLQGAVRETELAATNVMTKLQRADAILEGLVRYLQGSASGKIIPIIEQTQECLRTNNELFIQFLAERTAAMAESRNRLVLITDSVHSLDGIVLSIREVAEQTNLLALNATIEAARVGEAGRGFAVVASEVKALSLQSDRAAKDISKGLQTVTAAIDESVEALTVRQAREEKLDLDLISLTIDQLGKDLKSLVEHEQEILVKTQQDNEEIARIVMELLGSMQFQDLVSQRLNKANENLEYVVDHAINLAAAIQRARVGKYSATDFDNTPSKINNTLRADDDNRPIELF